MVRTRMKLLARGFDRSFVARGYLHDLYLQRCDVRLRQPITSAVGRTIHCYFPGRHSHAAYRSRPLISHRRDGYRYAGRRHGIVLTVFSDQKCTAKPLDLL